MPKQWSCRRSSIRGMHGLIQSNVRWATVMDLCKHNVPQISSVRRRNDYQVAGLEWAPRPIRQPMVWANGSWIIIITLTLIWHVYLGAWQVLTTMICQVWYRFYAKYDTRNMYLLRFQNVQRFQVSQDCVNGFTITAAVLSFKENTIVKEWKILEFWLILPIKILIQCLEVCLRYSSYQSN